MDKRVLFNVLAKDFENAKEVSAVEPSRILVGIMVKNFSTNKEVIETAKKYIDHNIMTSIGLGAGDPAMWKRVAEVSEAVLPNHINQVFPAAGYTLGKVEQGYNGREFILNSLIEPADKPGLVYISTGEVSQYKKEAISCEAAAAMMADIGLNSVKFYPVEGRKKIDNIKTMAQAAVRAGIEIFEPTGSIDLENVYDIVGVCLEAGVKTVIPHLYTSLIDKNTGKTRPEDIEKLIAMKWQ